LVLAASAMENAFSKIFASALQKRHLRSSGWERSEAVQDSNSIEQLAGGRSDEF
jgi:hypothetical protein